MRYDLSMNHVLTDYDKEERPWGNFERFTLNERSTVKILRLKPNQSLSLQKHEHREEFWHVIGGSGVLQMDEQMREIKKGDEALFKIGTVHRVTAGAEGFEVLEISFGEFNEADIVRIQDNYGRAPEV
jgi:mannose-6-phosphate isomerase-like protein (cupin superfamily)